MIRYTIVIPVYNGETTVTPLFYKIKEVFSKTNYSFEVIFVDDNGNDNSWEVLKKLRTLFPEDIKLIKLSRNFGQHNALICGFEHAQGKYIITIDEDLQHDPADILKLISKQNEKDYDVVYGRHEDLKHSTIRNIGSKSLKKFISLSIPEIDPDYSAFRLMKSDIAKATVSMENSYTFIDGYLSWITKHSTSCIVSHSERRGGVSSYTTSKLIDHAINIFVTFSNYPIRLISKFSILLLICMTFYAIFIISRKVLYDDFAAGFPTLILTIGFGVALLMLTLGIIGEYIFRINLKTTKRPNYNVSKII